MITTLALAVLLAQDPKPAPKTVEDRVKELSDRIEALDRKAVALAAENAQLQLKVTEAELRRETLARQPGPAWVKRYAPAVEFSEKQTAEIEELWYVWTKQDFEKPCDVAGWKAREETLRSKLTPDQGTKLVRRVREEQESGVAMMVKGLVRMAKLPARMEEAVEKVVRPRLTQEEGVLLSAAHPEKVPAWTQMVGIVEAEFAELSKDLTEGERESLRKALDQWKPRSR
jgi:hypothetical protein